MLRCRSHWPPIRSADAGAWCYRMPRSSMLFHWRLVVLRHPLPFVVSSRSLLDAHQGSQLYTPCCLALSPATHLDASLLVPPHTEPRRSAPGQWRPSDWDTPHVRAKDKGFVHPVSIPPAFGDSPLHPASRFTQCCWVLSAALTHCAHGRLADVSLRSNPPVPQRLFADSLHAWLHA